MESKSLAPGYIRTGWKSEVYPLTEGKKGQIAKLSEVVNGVRLLFKNHRHAWNAAVIACRDDDRSRIEIFKSTGKWPEEKSLYCDSSRLHQVAVAGNPRMTDSGSELVQGLSGTFYRHHLADVSNGRVKNAFIRWYGAVRDRRRNKGSYAKAVRWAKRKPGRVVRDYGRPRLKRMGDSTSSYLHPDGFEVRGNRFLISRVPGSFKIAHLFPWSIVEGKAEVSTFGKRSNVVLSQLRTGDERGSQEGIREIKFDGASISEKAGRFFVSFKMQVPADWLIRKKTGNQVLGLDLGVHKAMVSGDANTRVVIEHELPRFWESRRMALLLKRKERWDRAMQRRKPKPGATPSKGYREAVEQVQLLHMEMTDLKRDAKHKLTNELVRRADCLVIEDLNVKGMVAKSELHTAGAKELRKRIHETGFGEIGRQLKYKAPLAQTKLIQASPWFPSTQTCSMCGHRLEGDERLRLRDRRFKCPSCGHEQDRDSNSSLTLGELGKRHASNMEPGEFIETDAEGNRTVPNKDRELSSESG